MRYRAIIGLAVMSVVGGGLFVHSLPASAHGGVEHETIGEASAHELATMEQMETAIALLKKLIALLEMKRELSLIVPASASTPVTPSALSDAPNDEMAEHHEEHDTESEHSAPPTPHLIVELEAHYGKTHVHVRYVDKPEDMFFVDAPLSNEDAIVHEVATKTGLSESTVKEAIVYTGLE
jgi:hypothetical protein